ncbi:MAG: N-carbamoyl-D-amino-acid hydrolase [Pseudomonadota bacterium]|nr:N-carbamoyl-D-amino-acid hydrolase [Pseudomonadota bacterium]MEE3099339.1 N-carbamoyl-D-amino-acid hydrolase [Pseudomonadota bacterium]
MQAKSSARPIVVAAAQMGPIALSETRAQCVARLLEMLREAAAAGCKLVVFPELCLTTFFPRWWIEDEAELDAFFETEMPGPVTRPLFEEAARLGVGFYMGYAELTVEDGEKRRYNTAILVDPTGRIVGKYRKVHLPGHADHRPARAFQHLEKRYFRPGNLGFPVWRTMDANLGMCICNDRRWPETYRVMALRSVEMVLLGYNTPNDHTGHAEIDDLSNFHNQLAMQAGAYQNATWVVGTAKCGTEEGSHMIGQSMIVAPSGEVAAMATTLEDEVVRARCDLDLARIYRETYFNFAAHREPTQYGPITAQKGAVGPTG